MGIISKIARGLTKKVTKKKSAKKKPSIKDLVQKDLKKIKKQAEKKKKIFAWLYNPGASNAHLEKYFNKNKILEKY